MPPRNLNPKVDAYIDRAKPFAMPILLHFRALIHKACPDVEETIKWSMPFFEYRGKILGNMAAFKEHCSFNLWGQEINAVLTGDNVVKTEGMGKFGRIATVKDLPPDKQMLSWLRQAAAFIESGNYTSPIAARKTAAKPPKEAIEAPSEFTTALKKNKQAATTFAAFSPSCQREYLEWIAEAKRPETRNKRITTAIEWIAEGKQRHWKYQNC
jgi:uncharacterized protein YdeI (YjbR/CyaY-like superfamily)